MMTKFHIQLFIIVLLFSTCVKENNSNTENNRLLLLYHVYADTTLIREFTYTSDNMILEQKMKWLYIKYKYDKDKPISYDLYEDSSIYSNMPLDRTEWVDSLNTKLTCEREFEYDDLGRICKSFNHYNHIDTSNYMIYEYSDSGLVKCISFYMKNKLSKQMIYEYDDMGNLTKEKTFFSSPQKKMILSIITDYEFDNKENPYYYFGNFAVPGFYTNPNNITKIITTDVELETTSLIENTYLYNDQGFPVSKNNTIHYVYK